MRPRTALKLKQLAIITTAWVAVGILISVYDHLVLHTAYTNGPSQAYSFSLTLAFNLCSAVIGSALGGSVLVFYVNERFQHKSYGYTILAITVSFAVIIAIIVLSLGIVAAPLRTGKPLGDPASLAVFKSFVFDSARAKNTMVWFMVVCTTQLLLQVSNKFGLGTFGDILRGKYNTPQEEKRIFMFLDLNASTSIAEQLGNEKYHDLLKDFFADITNPILDNKGVIHQYVGDEVIVAWRHRDGVEGNRCVQCFYDIKKLIDSRKDKYLSRYGLVPSFKAGIHSGKVVAGEVGIIKRDVTFSGDVLNTTSRILGMCKELNAEVIASAELLQELTSSRMFSAQPLGAIKLKGRAKEIYLNALSPAAL